MTADWQPVGQPQIDGLGIREIRNGVFRNGVPTELLRSEWFDPPFDVRHMVHVTMMPGSVWAWHCHLRQCDVIFPVLGHFRVAFYDDREDSPTYRTDVDCGFHATMMAINTAPVMPSLRAMWRAAIHVSSSREVGRRLGHVPAVA